jgi:hypothetical protein
MAIQTTIVVDARLFWEPQPDITENWTVITNPTTNWSTIPKPSETWTDAWAFDEVA